MYVINFCPPSASFFPLFYRPSVSAVYYGLLFVCLEGLGFRGFRESLALLLWTPGWQLSKKAQRLAPPQLGWLRFYMFQFFDFSLSCFLIFENIVLGGSCYCVVSGLALPKDSFLVGHPCEVVEIDGERHPQTPYKIAIKEGFTKTDRGLS